MTFWLLAEHPYMASKNDAALMLPANGLPDLGRALSRDHLREWVKHLRKDDWPEKIDSETNFFWRIYSELHQDDHVVLAGATDTLAIGEITGGYRYEKDETGGKYLWPVRWVAQDIPLKEFAKLRQPLGNTFLSEIPESEARVQFRKYLPSVSVRAYVAFRWIMVILLLVEFVYFWPKN